MMQLSSENMDIANIDTVIVDVPTFRTHKLANFKIQCRSYVIIKITLSNGAIGHGEASILGGPLWAEESVESIKSVIDVYLAPVLLGQCAANFENCALLMKSAATRNYSAKAGVESALFDAVGKALSMPATMFLGGVVRRSIPIIWVLASGDADQEIEEAKKKIALKQMNVFKIKFGFMKPEEDVARLRKIMAALPAGTKIIVDVNQVWSEATAIKWMPALTELGVSMVEQPLPASQPEALARIAKRVDIPILVDEGATTLQEIQQSGALGVGTVLSLKLVKSGGLLEMKRAAGVATANGMELYGGCLIESGIGAAAHLAVYSSLPALEWGTEQFGPLILENDLISSGIDYENFEVICPTGSGLGITIAEDYIRDYSRKGY
ncbi:MAG: mandelate racemase [Alphaproteobacteria bacterium]|nr:mandelate racemase [Alphaproteobacteria bacterium]